MVDSSLVRLINSQNVRGIGEVKEPKKYSMAEEAILTTLGSIRPPSPVMPPPRRTLGSGNFFFPADDIPTPKSVPQIAREVVAHVEEVVKPPVVAPPTPTRIELVGNDLYEKLAPKPKRPDEYYEQMSLYLLASHPKLRNFFHYWVYKSRVRRLQYKYFLEGNLISKKEEIWNGYLRHVQR